MERERGEKRKKKEKEKVDNKEAQKKLKAMMDLGAHTLRMVIPMGQVGACIGKGGTNVKRLRDDCEVFVSVLWSNSDLERVVEIKGIPENLSKATKLMCEFFGPQEVEGVDGSLRVHYQVVFLVPEYQIGSLIGKGGQIIRSASQETGARIDVGRERKGESTEKTVAILGTGLEAIGKATQWLATKLIENPLKPGVSNVPYKPPPPRSDKNREQNGTPPPFPPEFTPFGAPPFGPSPFEQAPGYTYAPPPYSTAPPPTTFVSGPPPYGPTSMPYRAPTTFTPDYPPPFPTYSQPTSYSQQAPSLPPRVQSPTYPTSPPPIFYDKTSTRGEETVPASKTQDTSGSTDVKISSASVAELPIPLTAIAGVIGRAAAIIQNIHRQSGASIKIAEAVPGSTNRVATITGTEQAVRKAVLLIQNRIAEVTPPTQQ